MMRKRLGWTIFGFVVAIIAIALLAQRQIGSFLFDRAIDQRIGRDISTELPDGLHVFMCGTGAPLADAQRAGPCIAVLAGEHGFVFDSGSGSTRKLGAMAFPLDNLDAVFLSHLHSDHIDGLGELLLQAWIAGSRDRPLPVYGPVGVDRVVKGIGEAYAGDRGFRIAHHGPQVANPTGFGGEPNTIPADRLGDSGGVIYRRDGVVIRAVNVQHAPVHPAFGYRIDYGGRSIVISGDTAYSPSLERMAKGSEVIFHEALNRQMVRKMGVAFARNQLPNVAKIMADIQSYHASPEDAARLAKNAGARALVLYHLIPAVPMGYLERAFLGDAPALFGGKLVVSQDGLIVSLPANGKGIEFDQAY